MVERTLELESRATLEYDFETFSVHAPSSANKTKPRFQVPLKNVLWAAVINRSVQVDIVVNKRGVVKVEGKVPDAQAERARNWAQELMQAAYAGVKPQRRFLVVINPHGGPGKAPTIFKTKVEPILKSAHTYYNPIFTKYYQHAVKIGAELPVDEYDAIICVSGDGIIHELYNGMAQHKRPRKAFRVPVAQIPAGSGNGLSLNLLGLKEGGSVFAAALNAIKGRPMAVDICSIVQGGKRSYSHMSQCLGLMADLDLGTEHLRILGSNRFVYGYIRGVVTHKTYPFSIEIKAKETDKQRMAQSLSETLQKQAGELFLNPDSSEDSDAMPSLRYANEDSSDWIKLDEAVCFVYGGKCSYVSRDLMQFPVGIPNDGVVDLVVQRTVSRGEMLSLMDGAEKGSIFWKESNLYYKALAYRVKPLTKTGYLSIDGEKFPFEEFHVEVHQGLGTMLSCYGYYHSEGNAALTGAPTN